MMTTAMLPPHQRSEEVSSADLNSLLGGRTFGAYNHYVPPSAEETSFSPIYPSKPYGPYKYSEDDLKELHDYCQKRGIIGVNFNNMHPRAVLDMLKEKQGMREQTTKRGLING